MKAGKLPLEKCSISQLDIMGFFSEGRKSEADRNQILTCYICVSWIVPPSFPGYQHGIMDENKSANFFDFL